MVLLGPAAELPSVTGEYLFVNFVDFVDSQNTRSKRSVHEKHEKHKKRPWRFGGEAGDCGNYLVIRTGGSHRRPFPDYFPVWPFSPVRRRA